MKYDRSGRRPTGGFADLTSKPVNRVRGHCERCGCGVDRKKRLCLPCAADQYDEKLEARRARAKAARSMRASPGTCVPTSAERKW